MSINYNIRNETGIGRVGAHRQILSDLYSSKFEILKRKHDFLAKLKLPKLKIKYRIRQKTTYPQQNLKSF